MPKIRLSRAQRRVLQRLNDGGKLYTTWPCDIWRDSDLQPIRKDLVRKLIKASLITQVDERFRTGTLLIYILTGVGHDTLHANGGPDDRV